MAIIGVAVILHFVCLMIRTAWVVHHHDEGAIYRSANSLLIEALWGITLCLALWLSVFVSKGIGEFLYRLSQSQTQHTIDSAEHFCLALLYCLCRCLAGRHLI